MSFAISIPLHTTPFEGFSGNGGTFSMLITRRIPVISNASFTGGNQSNPCGQHSNPGRATRTTYGIANRGIHRCRGNRNHLCQLPPRRAPHPAGEMGLDSSASGFKRNLGATRPLSVLSRLSLPGAKPIFSPLIRICAPVHGSASPHRYTVSLTCDRLLLAFDAHAHRTVPLHQPQLHWL
jgi:hypothetical protein